MNKVTITSQDTKCTTTYMAEISSFLLNFRNEEMRRCEVVDMGFFTGTLKF
jgi:hypothetical protein